jgi:hypothetical protein
VPAPMIIGVFLLTVGVVLFLLFPILKGESASLDRFAGELTDAEARKRAALRALRDVDYDYHTGKLDDSDYRELKTALSHDALLAMGKVEAERMSAGPVGMGTLTDEQLEAEIAQARVGLKEGWVCGACGHGNVEASRFCAMCGGKLPDADSQIEDAPDSDAE